MITERHVLNILRLNYAIALIAIKIFKIFDAAHSSVFVHKAGFDKLVKMSFCQVIIKR